MLGLTAGLAMTELHAQKILNTQNSGRAVAPKRPFTLERRGRQKQPHSHNAKKALRAGGGAKQLFGALGLWGCCWVVLGGVFLHSTKEHFGAAELGLLACLLASAFCSAPV